ncbi:hypothetical protein ACQ4PT_020191 [Festuca glaucescens]
MDNPQLPDDMLVKIFLGLPDPADLGRSSVACKSFRNLITGQYFQRKYRKHQNPPLLGLVDEFGMFHRAIPPHPSAPAARVVSEAADFDFNFVNAKSMLKVLDIRDGRVLLSERVSGDGDLEDYLVCDPLHRKFVRLPRMSEPKRRNVFLAPPEVSAGDDDNDGEKAFQVIRMALKGDQVHTMVFSSSTGQWQAGPSAILEEATASRLFTVVGVTSNCHAQFAHGSFYFLTGKGRETVRLELSLMEISIFNGPPAAAVRGNYFGIMEEKNGAFGLIQGDDSGVEDDNDKDDDGSGGVDASGSSELQSQAVEQLKVPDLSHLISNAGASTTAQDDADDEDVAGDDPGQRAEV